MAEGAAGEFQQRKKLSCKLVPWLTWEEWNFVRESLFSSSPDSVSVALRRISAWRARGPLPLEIEITTAFIEIQQKDPIFRDGAANDTLNSDGMLAMLYCMAIIRLVNGFLDKSCKEAKLSISQAAEAIGIPRILVDIRHESSHRGLPSLPLVRSASLKALDWLKSSYWEPQRNLIPNVRKETESRMHKMALYLNAKKLQQRDSSQNKRKRAKHSKLLFGCNRPLPLTTRVIRCSNSRGLSSKGLKKQSSLLGSLIRLYSVFPSEVVAVLLEFPMKAFDSLDRVEVVKCSGDSQAEINPSDSKSFQCTVDDWKAIITKLASEEPALLLTILEQVLVMIESREAMRFEMGEFHLPSAQYRAEIRQIEHLSSLLPWLLRNMIEAKDSGSMQSANSCHSDAIPKDMLSTLLKKCLLFLTPGNTYLLDSAVLIAKLMGKNSLAERLNKLPMQNAPNPDQTIEDSTEDLERALHQQQDSINQAAKKLEFLISCRRKGKTVMTEATDDGLEGKTWTVAKSWSKCPIGMLPRTLGSSGVLSVLETANGQLQEHKKPVENKECCKCSGKTEPSCNLEAEENLSAVKKMRVMVDDGIELLDSQDGSTLAPRDGSILAPVKGQLMIGGVWKKVGEEELVAIENGVRILV
ncbi:hypothetical protein MRB53_004363 [Persea americana]|uniref:Uncharacterized protein n=1 Tax=Persea americana TaxID=3435 RepID=A0ACC2MAF2_PERAE|nr:hypothetical protein MRB53_004363 [Persea americana]|eukprot:TRINITY_DN33981_c0_g1_i3.p1 TRINITY_DN33981_c0_g1~~TRINITY_DN33981_c0_g1_i3.p1  ORF type:complete len:639 (+),score=135.01 TRINITY_DN33981_c0_g1_i3:83-1999(+)